MKKIHIFTRVLSALLVLSLLLFSSAASAQTFASLSQLQRFLENHSPAQVMATGTHYLEVEGTIESITWAGANNHYDIILLVEDDGKAYIPIGASSPQLRVHFRLHKDQPPFQPGDVITVFGSVNELYSSVIIPMILAKTINGSDDF